MSSTRELDSAYILPTYARFNLAIAGGKGCRCVDEEGKSYLDFGSGIGVNSLGWCDEDWQAAVAKQAATLQHTSNLYYTRPGALLARALCERTGLNKVFFCNSGAEANEGAIKAARKYSLDKYGPGRHTVVTLENSFHGRTIATLTATGQDSFHRYFGPLLPGIAHTPANDAAALDKALGKGVCALLLEVVQGEGGVMPLNEEFLHTAARLCRERDILLAVDEVQTGVGRTGSFLASLQFGLTPDVVTLAKGLGGGLPIGAFLLGEKCAGALGPGEHGSTYGANPVCCAGALVVMDKVDEWLLAGVRRKGERLRAALEAMPAVEQVSGMGLMLGVQLRAGLSARQAVQKAMDKGLLCLLAKDRLRLLPPLVVSDGEVEEGITILQEVLV